MLILVFLGGGGTIMPDLAYFASSFLYRWSNSDNFLYTWNSWIPNGESSEPICDSILGIDKTHPYDVGKNRHNFWLNSIIKQLLLTLVIGGQYLTSYILCAEQAENSHDMSYNDDQNLISSQVKKGHIEVIIARLPLLTV